MVPHPRSRRGFTLIELLVVIGISLAIAGLAVAFLPHLDRHKGVPNGITQIQGWLNVTKMQALRDKAPRGLRLIHDGTGRITSVVYIEQPDPIAPSGPNIEAWVMARNPNELNPPPNNLPPTPNFNEGQVTLVNAAVPGAPVPMTWEGVEVGDYFQITDTPAIVARIVGIDTPPGAPSPPRSRLTLDRPVDGTETNIPLRLASGFRIIRAPRPLAGEPALQLHKDIYIDVANCYPCPVIPANAGITIDTNWNYYAPWGSVPNGAPTINGQEFHIDILFNSYGTVANAPAGYYGIFVRHIDRPAEQAALVIYTRTGKISAITPNDAGGDPYQFAKDGKNPGI